MRNNMPSSSHSEESGGCQICGDAPLPPFTTAGIEDLKQDHPLVVAMAKQAEVIRILHDYKRGLELDPALGATMLRNLLQRTAIEELLHQMCDHGLVIAKLADLMAAVKKPDVEPHS